MRFVQLVVDSFQGIERAKVEFGPGLNVLYGPNDLGKSTLVTALRAALLVPSKSSDADPFVSWYRDASPQVTLTFTDDTERYWRVKKSYRPASAELAFSKDGQDFSLDKKAREVDERLRELLSWGASALGGKGGRGQSQTFLGNALLAGQTDVESVLSKGIENDPTETGKVRLTKALAALAQDPLFKHVLEQAQAEVDAFFTATGKRRTGANAKLSNASNVVKQLQNEAAVIQQDVDQLLATETQANQLRERAHEAQTRAQDVEALLGRAREAFAASAQRREVEARLASARAVLAKIDAQANVVAKATAELADLQRTADTRQTSVEAASGAVVEAKAAVKAAEKALQAAQSKDGAQAAALLKANLENKAATLEAAKVKLEAQRETATRVIAQRQALAKARRDLEALETERTKLQAEFAAAGAAVLESGHEVELARAIIDYGRWQTAAKAFERSQTSAAEAAQLLSRAAQVEAQAIALDGVVAAEDAALRELEASLPSDVQLRQLEALKQSLELAEAKIGGGLSVTVRAKNSVALVSQADDDAPLEELKASGERTIEAERKVTLGIGKLVDIEIVAGSKEVRRQRDVLKKRWRAEVEPALERAQVADLKELRAHFDALQQRVQATKTKRDEAVRLRAEAQSGRKQAEALTAQRSEATLAELQQRKDRIPEGQLEVLGAMFASMGSSWEADAEALLRKAEQQQTTRQAAATKAQTGLSVLDDRQKRDATAVVELERTTPKEDPSTQLTQFDADLLRTRAELEAVRVELAATASAQTTQVKKAQDALAQATTWLEQLSATQQAAQAALDEARAAVQERRGQLQALTAQLEAMNRPAALADVANVEHQLAAMPGGSVVTEEQVRALEAQLSTARQEASDALAEFHKADGALTKVGGPALRERQQQVADALVAARAREAELELDSQAWRLLRDTLRESENAEGAHLGRALAGPVAEQFEALTHGRYGSVSIDADLKMGGVLATGTTAEGANVLEALSVGTRDQLATLVRVAIARQLKTALVLDDHLVHTDAGRLGWFMQVLRQTALEAQVLIFTCRPQDYLNAAQLEGEPTRDFAGGALRAIDLSRVIVRSTRPTETAR